MATPVELHASGESVRMKLTMDRMHDDERTKRAATAWAGDLWKLEDVLGTRGRAGARP